MANYRNAPKLYHEGSKPKGYFYQLPQRLMDAVFQKFDGKNGNAIKILVALIGTAGDGSFAISEKWIKARTGIGKQSYHRTMDSLVASGYVIKENGKVILNLPLLMEDTIKCSDGNKTITHIQLKFSTQRQDASFMDSVLKNYLEAYLIDKNRYFKLVYDFSVAAGNLSKLFSGNLDKNSKEFWKTKVDNIKKETSLWNWNNFDFEDFIRRISFENIFQNCPVIAI